MTVTLCVLIVAACLVLGWLVFLCLELTDALIRWARG